MTIRAVDNIRRSIGLVRRRSRAADMAPPPAIGGRFEIGLGIALICICVASVALDDPSIAFRKSLSPTITTIFRSVTDVGKSDWILIPIAIVLAAVSIIDWRRLGGAVKAKLSMLVIYGSYVFATVAASGLLVIVLKILFGRARPKFYDTVGAYQFTPFTVDAGYASFPSGHATTVFALMGACLFLFPRWRWVLLALGIWSATSRFFVAAHYPSDVAVGMLIGYGTAFWMAEMMARRRLGFRIRADGRPIARHVRWAVAALPILARTVLRR